MIKTIDTKSIQLAIEILLRKRDTIPPAVSLPIADVERLTECLKMLEAAPEVSDSVPMPQNADQGQLMANAGIEWLRSNAPDRLKPEVKAEPVMYQVRQRWRDEDRWWRWEECSKERAESYKQPHKKHLKCDHGDDGFVYEVRELYLHPPAVDVVERIRALLKVIPEYASVNGHQLIYDIIRRIEGAK